VRRLRAPRRPRTPGPRMRAVLSETIVLASVADADEIGAMHVRSWQGAYQGLMPQEYLGQLDPAERADRWRRILRDVDSYRGGVLIATTAAGIVGFAAYGPTRDDDGDPDRTGEVGAIYLLPEAWGKGKGRRLMAAALRNLAEAGYLDATLWVLDSNARARQFYAAGGWGQDGAVKHDDRHGFPLTEVRYRRSLP
jgi:GNAT superfamily N-acetyltransferase